LFSGCFCKEYAESRKEPSLPSLNFEEYVENIWLPVHLTEEEYRPTTIAFHTYLLKTIHPYFEGMLLEKISQKTVEQYLMYLKKEHRTSLGLSLFYHTFWVFGDCTFSISVHSSKTVRNLVTSAQ